MIKWTYSFRFVCKITRFARTWLVKNVSTCLMWQVLFSCFFMKKGVPKVSSLDFWDTFFANGAFFNKNAPLFRRIAPFPAALRYFVTRTLHFEKSGFSF